MSTGTTMSDVDNISPASHGHRHGHTRGHGHSRSTRRMQAPIPQSLSSSNLPLTGEQPSLPLNGSGHFNGSISDATRKSHHHSHSHASVCDETHDSFHDHAAHHSKAGNVVGLVRETPVTTADAASISSHEAVSGIIIALPWIALSWYGYQYTHWDAPKSTSNDPTQTAPPNANLDQIVQKTCALTAVTMMMLGGGQIIRLIQRDGSSSVAVLPKLSSDAVSAAFVRMCSIGLPTYAAFKVGGFLPAFALPLAMASGVPTIAYGRGPRNGAQEKLSQKKTTVALLITIVVLSFLGLNTPWDRDPLLGYISLLMSIFLVRPPFAGPAASEAGLGISVPAFGSDSKSSSTLASPHDSVLTLIFGFLLALATIFLSGGFPSGTLELPYLLITAGAFAIPLLCQSASSLRSPHKIGLAIGTLSAALLCSPPLGDNLYVIYVARCILAGTSVFAARFDDKHLRLGSHSNCHTHPGNDASKATKFILRYSEPYPLLHSILKERDSRRIFYFMILNFAFMLIQLTYGFITGSLGLLSDSIHMFFDCLALVVGLCAAVMSKWPPSARFPYGYGKVDTLSGFANGIFLMIISIEIIYEAVERLSSGSQMHRLGELLAVSFAGLLVNLVGIMAFEHGHAHGHDHGGHGHSHDNENMHGIFLHILADTLGSVAVVISTILVHFSGWSGYDPIASCLIAILIFASAVPLVSSTAKKLLLALPGDIEYNVRETLAGVSTLRGVVGYTVPKFWLDDTATTSGHDHGHDHSRSDSHSHGHNHSHSHDHHSHSHSLNHNHNHNHSHDHDHNHDHGHSHSHSHSHGHDHDHTHQKQNPNVLGVIHVIASRGADLEDVRQRTVDFLREKNMDILVQVEREGDARCWCKGGNKSSSLVYA